MNSNNNIIRFDKFQSYAKALIAVAILLTTFGIANAQLSTNKIEEVSVRGNFDLVGTWLLTIHPSDGSPSFVGYYTFFADGNASFSSAGPPLPALGNPGYGVWEKVERNKFNSNIRMNSYTETLQFDGTLRIKAKITMKDRNTFVTEDNVGIYDPDGNLIVTLGGSARGKRMTIDD